MKVPGVGFVGVGRVVGRALPAKDFKVGTPAGEASVLEVARRAQYDGGANPEDAEYFVPIQWLETVPLERAVRDIGLFGNQNTVCKPTTPKWRSTVDLLKQRFPNYDRA